MTVISERQKNLHTVIKHLLVRGTLGIQQVPAITVLHFRLQFKTHKQTVSNMNASF